MIQEEIYNRAILWISNWDKFDFTPNYTTNINTNKLTNKFSDNYNLNKVVTDIASHTVWSSDGSIVWWTTDVKVTATDNNTVSWNTSKIYLPNWEQYDISSWDTWDMTNTTYIYYDNSDKLVHITTTPQQSVGKNKILFCVASPVDDTTKKAEFQVFWTKWNNKLITWDTIAGNTIAGNSIIANDLTSREINTSSINIWDWDWSLDDVVDWTTYAKIKWTSLQDWEVLFDNVLDWTTYGKVKKTALTTDWLVSIDATVDWAYSKVKASALNSDWLVILDQTVDWTYWKVKKSSLDANWLVVLSETTWTLDDINDWTNYSKVLSTSVSAGKIKLDETVEWTYWKVLASWLDSWKVKLDDTKDWTYSKVLSTSISSWKIVLSETIWNIDDISDWTDYAKVLKTYINAGKIDLINWNKELLIDFNSTDPTIHFRADVWWNKTDVWYLYWHSSDVTIWGSTYTINWIYTSSNLWTQWDCFIQDDLIVWDEILSWWNVTFSWWYSTVDDYPFRVTSTETRINQKLRIPVWTDLYT